MGKLAGFIADEVIPKLRRAGFVFDAKQKGATKYGGILKRVLALQCLTTLATYLKEHYELSCVKLD